MSTATITSDFTSFLPQNDEVDGANIQGQLTDHRSSDVKDKCDVLVSEELHLVHAELVLLSDNNEAEDELRLGGDSRISRRSQGCCDLSGLLMMRSWLRCGV